MLLAWTKAYLRQRLFINHVQVDLKHSPHFQFSRPFLYSAPHHVEIIMKSPLMNPRDSSADGRHLLEMRTSSGKGQGLFAKEKIDTGITILAETPLLKSNMSDSDIVNQFLRLSPDSRAAYQQLHSFPQARLTDRPSFSDMERTIIDIFAANSFRVGSEGVIYLIGSRFNHSCTPNIAVMTDPRGGKFFIATENIAKDQELYISYGRHSGTPKERKAWLKETWGFDCQCPECL